MNGARFVVECLAAHGVDTVFGYPGGAIMPFYDALVGAPLRHILTRHEQGAAFAANGYARASGRLGVAIATSGPGATNLVTGIADAFLDSVPLLVITGQVPTGLIGTDAFQEIDVLGLSLAITKHSYLARSVEELAEILPEAIALAQSGRPGPVLVDIPKDVQLAQLPPGRRPRVVTQEIPEPPDAHGLAQAEALLVRARRPIAYVGGGAVLANAVPAVREFIAATRMPVVTTLKGIGVIPGDDPLNLGMLGMHGAPCANLAVQRCDLLIAIGARFDDRATGRLAGFAPDAQVIHIDADPAETGKLRAADVALIGELSQALVALKRPLSIAEWRAECAADREHNGFALPAPTGRISPQRFLRRLAAAAGEETVISCDVGQHQMWVAQHYGFDRPRDHLSSGGLGTMGFGLPAAVGAQLARPGVRVINIAGDGSFMMNVQELATVRRYGLPIKVVLFDNAYLGMVRQQQELFFDNRLSEVDLSDNPDFTEVARAFGMPALRFERAEDLEAAVAACLETPGPLLLHIPVDREQNVWPTVAPGKANHEMLKESAA